MLDNVTWGYWVVISDVPDVVHTIVQATVGIRLPIAQVACRRDLFEEQLGSIRWIMTDS